MDQKIIHGDCLEVLKTMADDSVDAVVTDPPYGLSFMGRKWDYDVPSVEIWAECLRVLKPGGHLLAFAGTRTQHRMAVRIEDAGFEIRDMISWVYGSGFPKSLDVSKAIDKVNGEIGRLHKFTAFMRTTGLSAAQINEATETFMGSHYLTDKSQPAIPTKALWEKLRPLFGEVPTWADELVDRIEAEREVIGRAKNGCGNTESSLYKREGYADRETEYAITTPATDAARQWQGWGTALKPSLEPVTVARKPLIGTVAANVLEWGTGALNIDGCRVFSNGESLARPFGSGGISAAQFNAIPRGTITGYGLSGRWPANLIHDGSDEVVGLFPSSRSSGGGGKSTGDLGGKGGIWGSAKIGHDGSNSQYHDTGSAARFFKECRPDNDYSVRQVCYNNTFSESEESWQDQNHSQLNVATAEQSSCLQKASESIVQSVAVTWPSLAGIVSSDSMGHSITATPSELKTIAEACTTAMATIGCGFSQESRLEKHSQNGSLVSVAVTKRQTGTTTITVSLSKSDGCVGNATFNITPTNLDRGEAASRFRYCAKASKRDRDDGVTGEASVAGVGALRDSGRESQPRANAHPTVKPTDLMRYLCRLVTPPGGLVLDPFAGSGSTGKAAALEGFGFVGIEREEEYVEIARARIAHAVESAKNVQSDLFN
jgi:DNA modification methylase